MSDSALRIVHLYPAELGINGDRGNVMALAARLRWRGVECEIVDIAIGDALPSEADLVHVGSGPRSARDAVLPDARGHADRLHEWSTAGVPLVAIGAGLHLMGTRIRPLAGGELDGVGVVPVQTVDVDTRTVGEVLGERGAHGRIAGFLNHAARLEYTEPSPLTTLERGSTGPEGVVVGDRIGSHLHGPLLPLNPSLADRLLSAALARHGATLPAADDRVRQADDRARHARGAIAHRLGGARDDV